MRTRRNVGIVLSAATFIAAFFVFNSYALASDEFEAQANLFPPLGAPAPMAMGSVELERDEEEQEFEVEAEGLPSTSPPAPFEVWLETGVGTGAYFFVGVMEQDDDDEWELELEAEGSAPVQLCNGAPPCHLSDLAGRRVQVRATGGGTVYLEGIVPALVPCQQQPEVETVAMLQRPMPAPDPDAHGSVEMEIDGCEQEFEVEAEKLQGGQFAIFIEDSPGSGTYFFVGNMVLEDAINGEWEFERESVGSAPAELGVTDLTELHGRRLEIRDGAGTVYLFTVLPGLSQSLGQRNFSARLALSSPTIPPLSPKAKAQIKSKYKETDDRSLFQFKVKRLTPGSTYFLFIEDAPGAGTFSNAGAIPFTSPTSTSARLKSDTKKGDPLPLGVARVSFLLGRKIEIRDAQSNVHLSGILTHQ